MPAADHLSLLGTGGRPCDVGAWPASSWGLLCRFDAARPGYASKQGPLGQGFYRDQHSQPTLRQRQTAPSPAQASRRASATADKLLLLCRFDAAQPGYAFKRGPLGQGFYRDQHAQPAPKPQQSAPSPGQASRRALASTADKAAAKSGSDASDDDEDAAAATLRPVKGEFSMCSQAWRAAGEVSNGRQQMLMARTAEKLDWQPLLVTMCRRTLRQHRPLRQKLHQGILHHMQGCKMLLVYDTACV